MSLLKVLFSNIVINAFSACQEHNEINEFLVNFHQIQPHNDPGWSCSLVAKISRAPILTFPSFKSGSADVHLPWEGGKWPEGRQKRAGG